MSTTSTMKYEEMKALSLDALRERLTTERANLRKLVFAHSVTPVENPMQIRRTRRLIAQLETAKSALMNVYPLNKNNSHDNDSE